LLLFCGSLFATVMSQPSLSDRAYHRAVVIYGVFLSAIMRGGAAVHDCVQHGKAFVIDHSPEIACDYDDGLYQVLICSVSLPVPAFLSLSLARALSALCFSVTGAGSL
jgi:hypothetical protein